MKIQNMIIKPFAFDKKHFEIFTLSSVQPFLDYLTFEAFDNLTI